LADIVVSLYGEVQKEVIRDTLLVEDGIDVDFAPTSVVCVEHVVGVGKALHEMGPGNAFVATIGLRVEPSPGRSYRLEVELGSLPPAFHKAIEETVMSFLDQGLHGWAVHDVRVTLFHVAYSSPVSVAADFRNLTPLVLMEALKRAGTTVMEPVAHFDVEVPEDTAGPVLAALSAWGGVPDTVAFQDVTCLIDGTIPVRTVREFTQALPGASHGDGVLVSRFDSYREVVGVPPERARTDGNPLDSKEYLLHVVRRV